MQSCDCLIVGSGPAALGAAFELLERRPAAKVVIIEKEEISTGGLRNDCKMNFTFPVGFPLDYWDEARAMPYLDKIEKKLAVTIMGKTELEKYIKRAERVGVELLKIRQAHLGTDGGVKLIKKLGSELNEKQAELSFGEALLRTDKKQHVAFTTKRELHYKNLIVAPGRHGFDFLRKFMREQQIAFSDNSIDVGIRVELRGEHYPIVKDYYDPKFLFPDNTRTFCTNSGNAHVVQEQYLSSKGSVYYSVNGHAFSSGTTPNNMVNFAVLRSVAFTEPIASGQDYAETMAALSMLTGGGHPVMQRVGDFRLSKRTTRSALNDDLYDFEPTLKTATPGDIALAMPSKFLNSIWRSLKKLDTIVPGVLHPATIMYYPEIKLYANKPVFKNDKFLACEDIYLVGDGAGTSRGITGAWASGMRAAEAIAESLG
jgi:uncharacterized FAD-dependent dehydrogenase